MTLYQWHISVPGWAIAKKSIGLSESVIRSRPVKLALVYTALNDFDKAFEALNKSLDRREGLNGAANYLVLDKLKSDLRWKDVARRMNLSPKS